MWLRVPVKAVTVAWIVAALLSSGVAAYVLTPTVHVVAASRPFSETIPLSFGDWNVVTLPYLQVDPTVTRAGETSLNQPYDDILMRTYKNSRGELVMLTLAYGRQQRQDVKIHRPDLCYVAQGFKVASLESSSIPIAWEQDGQVASKRMKAVRDAKLGGYTEYVSYWMRIGSMYTDGAFDTRMHILSEGMAGRVPDGVLVRASRVTPNGNDGSAVHAALEAFLVELVAAAPADARRMMVH